ncbi:PREDICTED: uncharacterized protein LOC109128284 [Camelina sativa]|uniref:Uncharacterized protein LOC109128284 n=1 Tax=Camelina sativa TaxID=90675 RepID=A0ABM1QSW0_CAMSA|nr:PREDICTED: uncharacterized protein LOC109128284 [Camelina sativa]
MAKLIWLLFFRSGSVWVAWFSAAVLSDNLSKFWTLKPNSKYSWITNKLLKIRDSVYPWIKVNVGDGSSCQFWTDHWSKLGRMETYLSGVGLYQIGIPRGARLADLWRRGDWRLPPARSDALVNVHIELSTITLLQHPDSYCWWIDDHLKDSHTTGNICSALKEKLPTVPWHSIVWFSGGIPKHKFLTWLFVLNRCPTRDRMLNWGLQVDSYCLLCAAEPESRDHLFFDCSFAWLVWRTVAERCLFTPSRSWSVKLQSLLSFRGPRVLKKLLLLAWQATIYTLWTESNYRLHRNNYKSSDLLLRQIDNIVRNKASSFRDMNPTLSLDLLHLWFSNYARMIP